MKIECGKRYKDESKSEKFIYRINMNCVKNKNGMVDKREVKVLERWKTD
jgi:hypothetical protein